MKTSLSEKIWQIPWDELLPRQICDGVTCEYSDYETIDQFFKNETPNVYQSPNSQFLGASDESETARRTFYETCGDFFVFREQSLIKGIFIGNAIDWSGYYLRNASFLPELQQKQVYQTFLGWLLRVLSEHGVIRAEGDVAPNHLAHIHILNKLKFRNVGTILTDRWGAQLRFCCYLRDSVEERFDSRFCAHFFPKKTQIKKEEL